MNATGIGARPRHVRTDQVMGTVASIHVVGGAPTARMEHAVSACFAELHDVDRAFSPFRSDSHVSRLRAGTASLADVDPVVADVMAECAELGERTAGRFDAWWRGWFDPTGYVKGWAVERAARRHLRPLLGMRGVEAVGIGVGGDLQLFTAPGSPWTWRVGIADPLHAGAVLATVSLISGAVATSGMAERGAHIVDPRDGSIAVGALSATVIADGLAVADAWATVGVVAGVGDLSWLPAAPIASGMVVGPDARVRRWLRGIEVTTRVVAPVANAASAA